MQFVSATASRDGGKECDMTNIANIHKGKTPVRRHFFAEWLEARGMKPMEFMNAWNELHPDQIIDKSQVYRWLKGQLPRPESMLRIAAILHLEHEDGSPDPDALLRHPDNDWFARKLKGRPREEIERIKQVIDAAFPDKTGTNG